MRKIKQVHAYQDGYADQEAGAHEVLLFALYKVCKADEVIRAHHYHCMIEQPKPVVPLAVEGSVVSEVAQTKIKYRNQDHNLNPSFVHEERH